MLVLNIFQRLRFSVGLFVVLTLFLSGCGGGGGGGSTNPPNGTSGKVTLSGVVQKGPLIINSTVIAGELNAALSPTGKQYTFHIADDLGRFDPSATTFTSTFIDLNANGYYYDEVTNAVSSGPLTLQGIADLDTDTAMNVNLLSTLAYNRIKTLVGTGKSIAAARTQAEAEVLKAFYIYNGNAFGSFGNLDISKHRDGDNILAAISSLFVNGNNAGNLSALIANFQSDLSDNGVIDTSSIKAALATSASTLAPATVAANLTAKYIGVTTAYATKDISDWIDQDGDGVIGRYEFQVPNAGATTAYTLPAYAVAQLAGSNITLSAGTLSINGTAVTGTVTVKSGDLVTVSPPAGSFTAGVQDAYLLKDTTRIIKVSFLSGLQSIAITPANASTPNGLTQKLTATATFTDSSTQALSGATWASNNTAVATVDTSGTVTGKSVGSATISATFSGITGSIAFSVTPAVLTSISVSNPSIAVGLSQQLTATGGYSDTTTADITSSVSWSSASPSVATISAGGLATGVSAGAASITATSGAISGSATINITSVVLKSIAITPSLPTVAKGLTQQFTATGTYSDGTTQTLSGLTWTSGTPGVATINGSGLASTLAPGTSLITAMSGAISGTTTLTVGPAALTSISVSNPSISVGQTQQLTATGKYSDTTTADITSSVSWLSASPSVATVSTSGVAKGVSPGTASITATSGAISGSATINITSVVLQSIAITPSSPTVATGLTQQFTAIGTYSDSTTQTLTGLTWTSGTPGVATINGTGLASTLAPGTSLITATSAGTISISGSTTLTATGLSPCVWDNTNWDNSNWQ